MSKLSGIRDLDREILSKVDDIDLLKVCSINKYTWNIVCDDNYLRRRLMKYTDIEKYKTDKETWKQFFTRAINCIALLKEKYNYIYTVGNFRIQKFLFIDFDDRSKNELLVEASFRGEIPVIIWALKEGANIHYRANYALTLACENGDLKTIKCLVENGANVNDDNDYALRNIGKNISRVEIVKYLVSKGANIHAVNEEALRYYSKFGDIETVKYLVSKGANIHIYNYEALRWAKEYKRIEVEEFLRSQLI
jgi:hypothetical protein